MKKIFSCLLAASLSCIFLTQGCRQFKNPVMPSAATPTITGTPPSPTDTATMTDTPTITQTCTITQTMTYSPTASITITITLTSTDSSTSTITQTATITQTFTPTSTATFDPNAGITWPNATTAAAFSGRSNHTSLAYNNKMWVMGGVNCSTCYLDDVWSSVDGTTWTQATAAA